MESGRKAAGYAINGELEGGAVQIECGIPKTFPS